MCSVFYKAIRIHRYKNFADVTFWMVKLFIAGFMVRTILGHGILRFRNRQITGVTTETFWMPISSHAAQISSMDFPIAASTNSVSLWIREWIREEGTSKIVWRCSRRRLPRGRLPRGRFHVQTLLKSHSEQCVFFQLRFGLYYFFCLSHLPPRWRVRSLARSRLCQNRTIRRPPKQELYLVPNSHRCRCSKPQSYPNFCHHLRVAYRDDGIDLGRLCGSIL